MLTPPEDNDKCGKFRSYIKHPGHWQKCGEELFEKLKCFNMQTTKPKNVKLTFDLKILSTDKFISFGDDNEHSLLKKRAEYFQNIEETVCDLVFLDADNGLEVDSMTNATQHKYICCTDVQSLYNVGKNILIYQHRAIGQSFETQITCKLDKLGKLDELKNCPMIVFRGGNVSYILLCRNKKQVCAIKHEFDNQKFPDYFLKIHGVYPCLTPLKTN